VHEAPAAMLIPIWLLIFANIYFGIDTELSVSAALLAAQTLVCW
jgi:multicomponent Na+:H+ antiporter subunit D